MAVTSFVARSDVVIRPDANLANWQDAGVCEWAFGHVRELIPTERIGRGAGPVSDLDSGDSIDVDSVDVNLGEKRQSA